MEEVKKQSTRENGLDLLRLIAAFGVVLAHVLTPYMKYYSGLAEKGAYGFDSVSFVTVLLRMQNWAVTVFFMISGAFVLRSAKTADFKSFYQRTWKKLGIPTIIFSVIFIIVTPVYRVLSGSMPDIVTSFLYELLGALKGMPAEHMWYMFVLIGMYLMAPFLAMGREKIGSKAFARMSVIVYIWGTIGCLLEKPSFYWTLGTIINMLGIFMMGCTIHEKIGEKKSRSQGILFIFIGILFAFLIALVYIFGKLMSVLPGFIADIFGDLTPYNPFVSLGGGFLFAGFRLLDIRKDFFALAEITFYVYLVHPLVMMAVTLIEKGTLGIPYSVFGKPVSLAVIVINTIIVYVLSFVIGKLIVMSKAKKAKAGI